eukprot:TRINITY_DN11532_c0_g2_i1.p1 TRINITY_DN11532_c0_g2~~TRINITY_DN11532_c0_g2_i1.p1  ORF type:complete len:506 (-),score=157.50 TRINITY_DN11532_c0_g2_i1:1323-2840(-)
MGSEQAETANNARKRRGQMEGEEEQKEQENKESKKKPEQKANKKKTNKSREGSKTSKSVTHKSEEAEEEEEEKNSIVIPIPKKVMNAVPEQPQRSSKQKSREDNPSNKSLDEIADQEDEFRKKLREEEKKEQELKQALNKEKKDESLKMVQERRKQEEKISQLLAAQKKDEELRTEANRKTFKLEDQKLQAQQLQSDAKEASIRQQLASEIVKRQANVSSNYEELKQSESPVKTEFDVPLVLDESPGAMDRRRQERERARRELMEAQKVIRDQEIARLNIKRASAADKDLDPLDMERHQLLVLQRQRAEEEMKERHRFDYRSFPDLGTPVDRSSEIYPQIPLPSRDKADIQGSAVLSKPNSAHSDKDLHLPPSPYRFSEEVSPPDIPELKPIPQLSYTLDKDAEQSIPNSIEIPLVCLNFPLPQGTNGLLYAELDKSDKVYQLKNILGKEFLIHPKAVRIFYKGAELADDLIVSLGHFRGEILVFSIRVPKLQLPYVKTSIVYET